MGNHTDDNSGLHNLMKEYDNLYPLSPGYTTHGKLYAADALDPADKEKLDEVVEGVLWYADTISRTVNFHELHIEHETPCGYWLTHPYSHKPQWRSKGSKKAAKTRRDALHNLYARKLSYVSHSLRRLHDAQKQLMNVEEAWKIARKVKDE